ncbi:MAG TPA: hypothetical protein VI320_13190 [Terracidiphilus sp.]
MASIARVPLLVNHDPEPAVSNLVNLLHSSPGYKVGWGTVMA